MSTTCPETDGCDNALQFVSFIDYPNNTSLQGKRFETLEQAQKELLEDVELWEAEFEDSQCYSVPMVRKVGELEMVEGGNIGIEDSLSRRRWSLVVEWEQYTASTSDSIV